MQYALLNFVPIYCFSAKVKWKVKGRCSMIITKTVGHTRICRLKHNKADETYTYLTLFTEMLRIWPIKLLMYPQNVNIWILACRTLTLSRASEYYSMCCCNGQILNNQSKFEEAEEPARVALSMKQVNAQPVTTHGLFTSLKIHLNVPCEHLQTPLFLCHDSNCMARGVRRLV